MAVGSLLVDCAPAGCGVGDGPGVGVGAGISSLSPMRMRVQAASFKLFSNINGASRTPNFSAIVPQESPERTVYSCGGTGVGETGGSVGAGVSVGAASVAAICADAGSGVSVLAPAANTSPLANVTCCCCKVTCMLLPVLLPLPRNKKAAPATSPTTTAITPTTPHGTRRCAVADESIITVTGRTALLAPVTRLGVGSGGGTGLVMGRVSGKLGLAMGWMGLVAGLNCGNTMGLVGGKSNRGSSSFVSASRLSDS